MPEPSASHDLLPDLIGALQDRTNLTRSTLLTIIRRCKGLVEFKSNPQDFITEAAKQIQKALRDVDYRVATSVAEVTAL